MGASPVLVRGVGGVTGAARVQVKQGAHASKVQQADWRAGRKGGVNADVGIGADADDRRSAFTDVQVKTSGDAAPPATAANGKAENNGASKNGVEAAAAGEKTNGKAAPAPAPAAPAQGGEEWSKAQELALIKALKAIGKDVPDRCGLTAPCALALSRPHARICCEPAPYAACPALRTTSS